jgi:hypothetical protein
MNEDVGMLDRPTGPTELGLVNWCGFKRWPPRLPEQPIFWTASNEKYATQIAANWNVGDNMAGYVTRFYVRKAFIAQYPVHQVGGSTHTEWWIPAEELEELNENIIGFIEVVCEYYRN